MKNDQLTLDIESEILDIIFLALKEDIGSGDITTEQIIPLNRSINAKITAKSDGIICGLDIAGIVFKCIDKRIKLIKKVNDGSYIKKGRIIATVNGPARGILSGERTALNFLQRLSGIATLTNQYVKAAGNRISILDTRKTAPGLRALEKYAVKTGGGANHRIGLFDAVLIKDNHIAIVGKLSKAVDLAKKKYRQVEVEVEDLKMVEEAIGTGVTRIMLDNMNIDQIKKSVKLIKAAKRKIEIEISGGITLANIGQITKTGIDYVSIGALTHSAPALDISLKV